MRRYGAPVGLAALVLVLGFPALARYGVTWDEALGDFFFGERYLSYFLSLDERYLDFGSDPYPPGRVPDLSVSPFRDRPWEYYPVANVLAAATSRVLGARLGWVEAFDGFHAVNLFLAAALAAALYVFARRRFDTTTALVAVVLLFTSPHLLAHLLSNVKDVPEMVFFALALLAFAAAYERGSAAGLVGAGVIWGLALGTKANALFLPAIVLATVIAASRPARWRGRSAALWGALAASAVAGVAVAFASWPYLWEAPLQRAREHLEYIGLRLFSTRPESVISPLRAILLTTPLPFLALSIAGVVLALREARGRELRYVLPLAWAGTVLGRLYLPGAVNFDGVRHFLELFPALALLGGVATSRAVAAMRRSAALAQENAAGSARRHRLAAAALIALLLAPGIVAVARVHPFELAYWNALAGGLDGARARGLAQAGDYWATSYRTGLEWLGAHAPASTALAVPIAQHTVRLVAPLRLRADIGLLDLSRPEVPEVRPGTSDILARMASERPVYVMFALRDDWTNELIEDCRSRLHPLVRWTVDGEDVLVIYRWTPAASART